MKRSLVSVFLNLLWYLQLLLFFHVSTKEVQNNHKSWLEEMQSLWGIETKVFPKNVFYLLKVLTWKMFKPSAAYVNASPRFPFPQTKKIKTRVECHAIWVIWNMDSLAETMRLNNIFNTI